MDIDKLLAEYRARPAPTEEQIEAWAIEDDSVLTEADLANMRLVYPPPKPDEIIALRTRLGLTQRQLADMLSVFPNEIEQYEQDRGILPAPAAALLWVILAEPEAVVRAIEQRNARFRRAAEQEAAAE